MKKFNLNSVIIYSVLVIASMWSCKPVHTIQNDIAQTIPTRYAEAADSTSAASINWKEYFSDNHLINLIDTALLNNLDLKIAMQRIETANAGVQHYKGALFPTVHTAGTGAVRRFGLYTMDGAGNATTEIHDGEIVPVNLPDYYVGLQTAWEADVWRKLHNRKRAAVSRYLASVEGKNWAVTNLVTEVAVNYYELVALDYELDIIRETIALQDSALSIVTIQKQSGAANELAVKQFRAQLLNSKSLEVEVLQQIIMTETRINTLLGKYPKPIIRNKGTFVESLPNQITVGVPSDLLRNRPDIRQAELELLASKADVKSARAAFYPSLIITGGLGYQAYKTSLLFTSPQSFVFNLIGGLSAPLINRNSIKAEFKAANAYQVEALYNYQKSILNGYAEVYTEHSNLRNLQRIHAFKNEEVSVLKESIETSAELFRTGRANYLEIILTQRNALQAKLELINVKRNQFNSAINIYKALGGGWN